MNKTITTRLEALLLGISSMNNKEVSESLASILKFSKPLPGQHSILIDAWNKRSLEMGWGEDYLGIPSMLAQDKETSEAEQKDTLVEVKELTSRLDNLLAQPVPSSLEWNMDVRSCARRVREALGGWYQLDASE